MLVGIDGVSLYNIGLQAVARKLQDLVKNAQQVGRQDEIFPTIKHIINIYMQYVHIVVLICNHFFI